MMEFTYNTIGFNDYKSNLSYKRTYTLYRNGLHKTCNKHVAIELLSTGEWFDRTNYKDDEEKLHVQTKRETNIERSAAWQDGQPEQRRWSSTEGFNEERGGDGSSSSGWQESRHEQHQSNLCDRSRKEFDDEAIRSGSQCSEVKKSRGRPKKSE